MSKTKPSSGLLKYFFLLSSTSTKIGYIFNSIASIRYSIIRLLKIIYFIRLPSLYLLNELR